MNKSLKSGTRSYKVSFAKYGVSPQALQWANEDSQKIRFREMLHDLNLTGKTILDIGCGFGDIADYISLRTSEFEYTGVDVMEEFINSAKSLSKRRLVNKPKVKLNYIVNDYFGTPMPEKFDVVICSGAINSNIKNAISFRKKAIKTMWNHANQVVGFNMVGYYPQPENIKTNRVYYANSMEILEHCFTLTSRIIFRHHYHRKDFTVIMFK